MRKKLGNINREAEKIFTGNIWKEIQPFINGSRSFSAAIAYVTSERFIQFASGDVLICDASDLAIETGQTSAKLLASALKRGALLYSLPKLHAKMLVFDNSAFIGSANLSLSSEEELTELGVLTARPEIVAPCKAFIESLKEVSVKIDRHFIDRILEIKVEKRRASVARRKVKIDTRESKLWIVRTTVLDEERYKNETDYVEQAERELRPQFEDEESDLGYIRWAGKSRFREQAQPGDRVIELRSPRKSKRTEVREARVILSKQNVANWTRLYFEAPENSFSVSWTQFQKMLADTRLKGVSKQKITRLNETDARLIEDILRLASKRK